MATLALSVAGQFAGGLIGGPIGATLGRALGALAGSAIDTALFGEEEAVSNSPDVRLIGSAQGGVIPRIYGWNRVSGNIIWATNLERQTVVSSGSKGVASSESEEIIANFAIALCEGEVAYIGRIWADGRLLETEGLNFRFYSGTANQLPDTLIIAKQGLGNSPAYRGICYLVFDGLPLGQFGNRIPNISVELCRIVGDLEPSIKAITVIPGATEFGYDPVPRVRIVSAGKTEGENTHLLGQSSDWTLSLNELQALCPNLEHVALVVAWFGNDLRCDKCQIQPRVENATRQISGTQWMVSGKTRTQVPLMTQYQNGPAYGGTPSDAAVLAAIADLKKRGIKVTLYPIVLMDIAENNVLPDPYSSATSQSAYPWRGRITSDPAPRETGSPGQTSALTAQVDAFSGVAGVGDFQAGSATITYSGPSDWRYRRMILHYANIAVMAGGIDAMLIGSELRGLTWLRDSQTSFPFVNDLIALAADVRSIVGGSTKLTYAADWSEYSGYQPPDAPGDKLYNLDPLWADMNVDCVGIDNYMPLSDWRGVENEPDATIGTYSQQISYLSANIASGEGFDWYYASEADRIAATRTPITDTAYNQPWIWRYKDLTSWWSNQHHNRVNGVRDTNATNWVAQSKPVWFTELGCGAVDKGANSPNLFGDPKSSESGAPPFSDGTPDGLVQRQFLRAHHSWWQPESFDFAETNNPLSIQYSGRMLDPERLYVWTWDARPFPAFPTQVSVWADGGNYETGHWLTGRLGALSADELLTGIARDYGVSFAQSGTGKPLVHGAQIGNVVSLRRAIEPLLEATGLIMRDTASGLTVLNAADGVATSISFDNLVTVDAPIISRQSPNLDEEIGQLSLSYSDRFNEYQNATVTAIANSNPVQTGFVSNLILDGSKARNAAENILQKQQSTDNLELVLPPSLQAFEVGDSVNIAGERDGPFRIIKIRQNDSLSVSLRSKYQNEVASFASDISPFLALLPQITSVPVLSVAHFPGSGGEIDGSDLIFGAFAQPWPGEISIHNDTNGQSVATINASATMGNLTQPLLAATTNLWDRGGEIWLNLYDGQLSSASEDQVLAGTNRMAILKDNGSWEIVGFATANLVSGSAYVLTDLLRGTQRTDNATLNTASVGNSVLLLDNSINYVPVSISQLETTLALRAFAGNYDLVGQSLLQYLDPEIAKPMAPANLRAKKTATSNDIDLSWMRRTQIGGDSWSGSDVPLDFVPENYAVSIFSGSNEVRQINTSVSTLTYSASQQIADFGSALPSFTFSVQQRSAALGLGGSTTGAFPN